MSNPIGEMHLKQLRDWIEQMMARFPHNAAGDLLREANGRVDLSPIKEYLNNVGTLNRSRIARELKFGDRTVLNHHAECNRLLSAFERRLGLSPSGSGGLRQPAAVAQKELEHLRQALANTEGKWRQSERDLAAERRTSRRLRLRLERVEAIRDYQIATGRNVPAVVGEDEA